jgi:hypothetical protein
VRLLGIQAFLKMLEDHLNVIDMNQGAVLIQHFDEPAHMGALKVVR